MKQEQIGTAEHDDGEFCIEITEAMVEDRPSVRAMRRQVERLKRLDALTHSAAPGSDEERNRRIDAAVESALHKTGVAPYPKTRFETKRWRRFVRHLLAHLNP